MTYLEFNKNKIYICMIFNHVSNGKYRPQLWTSKIFLSVISLGWKNLQMTIFCLLKPALNVFLCKKKKVARKGWLYYAILRNKSIWIKLKGMGENHKFIYTKKKRYMVIKIWCLFYGTILLGHYYTYCSLHTIVIIYMYVTKRNVSFYMC